MQLALILFFAITLSFDKIMAAQTGSVRSMLYTDSDRTQIWENLFLYQLDLSAKTQLSAQYGLDTVSSATINTASQSTGVTNYSLDKQSITSPLDDEHDDEHEGSEEGTIPGSTSYRHSGSIALTHAFTHDIKSTSSFKFSDKDDYFSTTLGQSLTLPIVDSMTTLSGGVYWTNNQNSPKIDTTNAFILPPIGASLDSQDLTAIVSVERLLNTKQKVKLIAEVFSQKGYLSTGYQRVPITSGTPGGEALEVLPDSRNGYALSAIFSQWLNDDSAVHLRGRLYQDSYDIQALSGEIQYLKYWDEDIHWRLKYRYYTQTAASFWGSSFESVPDGYFSNHTSLGSFDAHQISAGLSWDHFDWGLISVDVSTYVTNRDFQFQTISVGLSHTF